MQGPIIISIVQWAQSFQVYSPQSFLRALSQTIFFVISPALTMIMVNQIKFTNVTCTFYRSFKFLQLIIILNRTNFTLTFILVLLLFRGFHFHILLDIYSSLNQKKAWKQLGAAQQSPPDHSPMTGFIYKKIKNNKNKF